MIHDNTVFLTAAYEKMKADAQECIDTYNHLPEGTPGWERRDYDSPEYWAKLKGVILSKLIDAYLDGMDAMNTARLQSDLSLITAKYSRELL